MNMRKNYLLGIMLLSLCLSACSSKPTTFEEQEKLESRQADEGEQKEENPLENLDLSAEHIQLQLGRSLKIDAKVTPSEIYQDGLHCYNYEQTDSFKKTTTTEEMVDVINQYYGEEVITVEFIKEEEESKERVISGKFVLASKKEGNAGKGEDFGENFGFTLKATKEDHSAHEMMYAGNNMCLLLSKLMFCPDGDTTGLEKVEKEISRVYQSFGNLTYSDFGTYHTITHFNEQLYENEKLLCQNSIEEHEGLDAKLSEEDREFYYVIGEQMTDDKIPVNLGFMHSYPVDDAKDVKGLIGYAAEEGRLYVEMPDPPSMVFDKDGKLQAITIMGGVEIKEPLEKVQIKNLKEMIEQFAKEIGTNGMMETEVYSIELVYDVYLSPDKDEKGVRKMYMAPCWKIQYHQQNTTHCGTRLYLAETGEKIVERD